MNYLKIMSAQDAADTDTCKGYTLHFLPATAMLEFSGPTAKRPQARVDITDIDGGTESFDIHGNAYLLNEAGDEIANFGVAGTAKDIEAIAQAKLDPEAVRRGESIRRGDAVRDAADDSNLNAGACGAG